MRYFGTPYRLRVNRADKNNRKGLGLKCNRSSISAILASLFGLEFSLQIYTELIGRTLDGLCCIYLPLKVLNTS
jgi:hypothetical protein